MRDGCVQDRHALVSENAGQPILVERNCGEAGGRAGLDLRHALVDHQRARNLSAGALEDDWRLRDPNPSTGSRLLPLPEEGLQLDIVFRSCEQTLRGLERLRGDLAGAHLKRAVDDQIDRETWRARALTEKIGRRGTE